MGLSTALAPATLLLLLFSWCQGAPVPDQATQLFSGLDVMLSSLGAERERRGAGYDKEFILEDLGVSIGLSYHDPSRKVRGGKLHFDTPQVNFVLDIDRDRGVNVTEGSFTFDIEYTINESGESGKFTIERTRQDDGQFRTKILNLPPDTDSVPMLNLEATSDFKTKFDIGLSFSYKTHAGNVKIKVENLFMRGTEDFSLDCEFEYNGKKYGAKGTLNKASRTGDLLVTSPERTYTLKGSIVTSGDTKITVEGNMMGKVSFIMNIKESFREAKLELTHKKAKLLQMKMRGEKVGENIQGEAKWALLGGKVAKGRADASIEPGSSSVVITPVKGRPITVSAFYPESEGDNTRFGFSGTKGGEKLFSYEGNLVRKDSANIYEVGLVSDIELREKSLMYSTGCRIGSLVGSGCFKTRKVSASVVIDKTNNKQLTVYFQDIKDAEQTLELTFNTLNSPYKVEIVSPLLLTTNLASDRMFVMLDYQPRARLTAETSYRNLKLDMRAEKTAEGRQFFVEMWREGVRNINYDLDVQYHETNAATTIHSRSNFDIKPESLLYPAFCSYGSGCFRHRESEVDIFIDNQNKNVLFPKFRLSATMAKDSVEAFSILADTTQSPYRFEMTAPNMLPDLIGVQSLEADITHTVEDRSYQFSPASQLLIKSSHPQMKTFEVTSSDDGIFVKQNAQLLMKVVNFVGGRDSNSLEADVIFRNSKQARLNMNWQNNEVVFTIVGGGLDITGNIQSAEEKLDFDISGVGPILGNFVIQQSVHWKSGDILGVGAKGRIETAKGLLTELALSPILNDIKLDWEKNNWIVNGHFTNHFQGEKYEIVFQDNSIQLDM